MVQMYRQELNLGSVLVFITHGNSDMSIGARLKSERLRLGLLQAAIGGGGGVEVNAHGQNESGKRMPRAEYLALIALASVDVLFVVTGNHSQNGNIDSFNAAESLDNATECLKKAKHLL